VWVQRDTGFEAETLADLVPGGGPQGSSNERRDGRGRISG